MNKTKKGVKTAPKKYSDDDFYSEDQEGTNKMDDASSSAKEKSSVKSKSDNTLGTLTKKFIDMITNQPEKTIEISIASQKLSIPKRRIYDITNVLEGIGYVEKISKNKMKWVGGTDDQQMLQEVMHLTKSILELEIKEKEIDTKIQEKTQQIQNEFQNSDLNYLTEHDLQEVMDKLCVQRMIVYLGCPGTAINTNLNPQNNSCQIIIETPIHKMKGIYTVCKSSFCKESHQVFSDSNEAPVQQKERIAETKQNENAGKATEKELKQNNGESKPS